MSSTFLLSFLRAGDAFAWIMQAIFDGFILILTIIRTLLNWREDGISARNEVRMALAELMFHDGTPASLSRSNIPTESGA